MGAEYPCHRILYDELAGSGKELLWQKNFYLYNIATMTWT